MTSCQFGGWKQVLTTDLYINLSVYGAVNVLLPVF